MTGFMCATMSETFEWDANSHLERGMWHSMMGRHSYAAGAYLKAVKDKVRAVKMRKWEMRMSPRGRAFVDAFEHDLLYGGSRRLT